MCVLCLHFSAFLDISFAAALAHASLHPHIQSKHTHTNHTLKHSHTAGACKGHSLSDRQSDRPTTRMNFAFKKEKIEKTAKKEKETFSISSTAFLGQPPHTSLLPLPHFSTLACSQCMACLFLPLLQVNLRHRLNLLTVCNEKQRPSTPPTPSTHTISGSSFP